MKQPPKSATNSTKGKNHPSSKSLLFTLFFTGVFTCTTFLLNAQIKPEDVSRSWKYEEIYLKSPGDQFKKVGAHDIMILRTGSSENTFSYALQLENIKASGTWQLNDSLLIFIYKPEDKPAAATVIRQFKILRLNQDSLLFREVLPGGKTGPSFSYSFLAE